MKHQFMTYVWLEQTTVGENRIFFIEPFGLWWAWVLGWPWKVSSAVQTRDENTPSKWHVLHFTSYV